MAQADKVFSTSIAAIYDELMGPMFFVPYAGDLARRAAAFKPATVLETAEGSGIATQALVQALPHAKITANDLNAAMIERAKAKPALTKVSFDVGDATKMSFADHIFDLVACQFGVMFFPDKAAAFSEARRVLKPGGTFLFSVWDSLDVNPVPATVLNALGQHFSSDPPTFMRRLPHGFFDVPTLTQALVDVGFVNVVAEHVLLPCEAQSAREVAVALCQGTPMRSEIEARDPNGLAAATAAAAEGLVKKFGPGPMRSTMQAIVFTAQA